jgi:hypothetical protein
MPLNAEAIRRRVKDFDFRNLFTQELGWEGHSASLTVAVDDKTYQLHALAEKRGFQVFECSASDAGNVLDYNTRSKIEQQVAKSAREHIIIYTDTDKSVQKWQWVRRELGRPLARREYDYTKGQTGEVLVQKLQYLAVDLAEEEEITLVDVTRRARQAFDVDRVTRRFYDRFETEHTAFLTFIKGITAVADSEWYASLMLNRLMFIYFIQKKGFLDADRDYLLNRLHRVQTERGRNNFLTFYRYFLLRLFHEGLGQPPAQRRRDLDGLLGTVPYLNGGLFDVHDLERTYPDIQIADEAFERLFGFFDAYQWHLDERPLRADNEINPDVLGYIFEKYVNQKQMGAYYTKEDITGYITRNTLIPFLFNSAEKKCAIAFKSDSALWRLLRDDPDRYIYPAMLKGVDSPLPEEVAAGLSDVSKRGNWNKLAAPEHALPTETWREHVARRQRCQDLRAKLKAGEIHDINDLITYNLDISQFAEDVIANCEGPELLRAFYQSIESVSVLDPTCGSGAFLFAALNLLEPLYEACLDRMQGFLDDLTRNGAKHHPEKFGDFRKILEDVERHPNRRYFILKSIIVGNLYGVDIMEEAVEICKLRLFLKLVAQVDTVQQIEPLPDIDFNIRAGNTLVGFARRADVQNILRNRLNFNQQVVERILADARRTDEDFRVFRRLQTQYGKDAIDFSEAKAALRRRLNELRIQLDRYLAGEYGVDLKDKAAYQNWHDRHQPFHWFAEFYGIMSGGGFDVIIGNPPWREYSEVRREYTVRGFVTERCGNLHCFCTERAIGLRSPDGRISFIVQLPLTSSLRMVPVRTLLRSSSNMLHVLSFDDRPGKLFDGLEHCRSVIFLSEAPHNGEVGSLTTTRYQRWLTEARCQLFDVLEFAHITRTPIYSYHFPKSASDLQEAIFAKVIDCSTETVKALVRRGETDDFIFYQEATGYWIKATVGLPYYAKNGNEGVPAHGRFLYFDRPRTTHAVCALLNSSLFYAYFITYGDCFHLSHTLATGFPISAELAGNKELAALNSRLMRDLRSKAEIKTIRTKDGSAISYAEFFVSQSKPILDEIDRVLAKHYGFTDEELDFILNYDIKYRMGQDGGDEEE